MARLALERTKEDQEDEKGGVMGLSDMASSLVEKEHVGDRDYVIPAQPRKRIGDHGETIHTVAHAQTQGNHAEVLSLMSIGKSTDSIRGNSIQVKGTEGQQRQPSPSMSSHSDRAQVPLLPKICLPASLPPSASEQTKGYRDKYSVFSSCCGPGHGNEHKPKRHSINATRTRARKRTTKQHSCHDVNICKY
ncbi:hypothetical protein BCR41DRAFT_345707 [Lobosporangium transversale]|uniref:Uncharacterized protein n=1 Tax=Lobosporangium transversale TaxID=64571 RepID=A0A1Y2GZF4_9FUNG|nr:hypothetical protein BCR41DRAFT_345707 [Lobosporangium transversale]ORZ27690.1 hypothetical protein BCR41DRAFT_345707 [Lobosporangium transversale]|eukprot:XP_021885393.1 hypothetical protein BCR41DRAFT_345707 [Lobosporangium transversale]